MKEYKIAVAGVLLACCTGVLGQSCPVTVERISNGGNRLQYTYKNISDKTITGIEFKSAYTDPVGTRTVGVKMVSGDKVKPGKKGYGNYAEYLYQDHQLITTLYVTKIVYADGSQWTPDPITQCGWSSK